MLTEIILALVAVAVLVAGVTLGRRLSFRVRVAIGALFLIAVWLTPFSWSIILISVAVVSSLWSAYRERQRADGEVQANGAG